MTPLDTAATERRPHFRNSYAPDQNGDLQRQVTGDQVWAAVSADGLWSYTRVDGVAGTPWEVVYRPTGQVVQHGSLPAARRWTAHDGGQHALANLRAGAQLVIDRRGDSGTVLMFNPGTSETVRAAARRREAEAAAERYGLARRCAGILDGLVLADAVDTRCAGADCGGYLTVAIAGDRAAWVHADACRECVDLPLVLRGECRALWRHTPCGDADPRLCEHLRCSAPTVLLAGQCSRGRDACCGCCDYDE